MRASALAALAALAVLAWPARPNQRCRAVRSDPADPGDPARLDPGHPATTYDVADALVLLALALRSGMGPREALEQVAGSGRGEVATHLASVAAALRWGQPGPDAWSFVPAVWRPAALAWEVAECAGAAPAQLVEEAARRVREREDRRLQAAAARAGVRLVLPLGLAFLPAFACTAVVPVVLALVHTVLGP
jgi:hypothetical protein